MFQLTKHVARFGAHARALRASRSFGPLSHCARHMCTNSAKTVEIVKATAPVVGESALELTTCFYKTLFQNDPAARAFFNEAHQAQGTQSAALANAIVAYASNIDNLDAIQDQIQRIAHRHVALSITASLYPIVHKNMMAAIGETLGDAVTPEIASAWSEAVLTLCRLLITTEAALSSQLAARKGGWRGEREFTLADKTKVSADTMRFRFVPADGYSGGFEFEPGQYLTIRIPSLGASPRQYTLTSEPGEAYLECTVRRVQGGLVSNYMHDSLSEGTPVLLGVPCGVFTPPTEPNAQGSVLVSAGIGVTPLWALFNHYKDSGQIKAIWCVYPDDERSLFVDEFRESEIPTTVHTTQSQGKPALMSESERLVEQSGREADFYICGPPMFMGAFKGALLKQGVAEENINMELFGTGGVPSGCPVDHHSTASATASEEA